MDEERGEIVAVGNRDTRTLVLGGLIGAGVGLLAAYLLLKRSDESEPIEISAGEGVKLGVLIFGLLRNIANL